MCGVNLSQSVHESRAIFELISEVVKLAVKTGPELMDQETRMFRDPTLVSSQEEDRGSACAETVGNGYNLARMLP